MEYSPDFTAPHDTTTSTPAGRKLRAWAITRSPEVQTATDSLAQALWANASNPPCDLLKADLVKRKAEFDKSKAA